MPTNTQRLNWIEKHKPLIAFSDGECRVTTPFMTFRGPTLSEAVDEGIEKLERLEGEIEEAVKQHG